MNELTFTKIEKDHIEWLVSQHKHEVLEMFDEADNEKTHEVLNVMLKVDQDICSKLWQDKENQNKIAEAKYKAERIKR